MCASTPIPIIPLASSVLRGVICVRTPSNDPLPFLYYVFHDWMNLRDQGVEISHQVHMLGSRKCLGSTIRGVFG